MDKKTNEQTNNADSVPSLTTLEKMRRQFAEMLKEIDRLKTENESLKKERHELIGEKQELKAKNNELIGYIENIGNIADAGLNINNNGK